MRVLVAAKEPLVGLALCEALESVGHVAIGPARSSGEALLLSDATRPHCAIIAEHLERNEVGAQLATRLRELHDVRVVMTNTATSVGEDTHRNRSYSDEGTYDAKAVVANLPGH